MFQIQIICSFDNVDLIETDSTSGPESANIQTYVYTGIVILRRVNRIFQLYSPSVGSHYNNNNNNITVSILILIRIYIYNIIGNACGGDKFMRAGPVVRLLLLLLLLLRI